MHAQSDESAGSTLPHSPHRAVYLPPQGPPVLLQPSTSTPSIPPSQLALPPGTSLIRIFYSAVNPADLKHRVLGCHSTIAGYDFAGLIISTTLGSPLSPGTPVCGSSPAGVGRDAKYGAHQEYVVANNDMLFSLATSESLGMAEAAASGIPLRTAAVGLYAVLGLTLPWDVLDGIRAANQDGGLLIWGGGSQVGAWAVQLAAASKVSPIFVVAAKRHHAALAKMGASHCFDYSGDGSSTVTRIIAKVQSDRIPLCRAFDAIGEGSQNSHMADRCQEVLRAACVNSQSHQIATVNEDGPPDAVSLQAEPDVDIEFDFPGRGITQINREEQAGEMVLQVIEWVIANYNQPFHVQGIRVIAEEDLPGEMLRIGRGGGKGLEKVVAQWTARGDDS